MRFEIAGKRSPVPVFHRHAQAIAVGVVRGQIVHLLVAHRLDEVFEPPQEYVGFP